MLGQWEGYGGAPSPCGARRRMSGSDEGRWMAWATILLGLRPMQVCAVSGHGGAFTLCPDYLMTAASGSLALLGWSST